MKKFNEHSAMIFNYVRPFRSAQVIAVALLSIVPLVGLVLLVLCTGDAVNRGIKTQNAADAAASAAANQAARAINLTSANNVEIARMLSAIITLDDMRRCLDNTDNQLRAFSESINSQLGVSLSSNDLNDATMAGCEIIAAEINYEIDLTNGFLDALDEVDIQQYTTWADGVTSIENPTGAFWQAAVDLGHINTATMENWGELVQAAAISAGGRHGVQTVVFPFAPESPAVAGDWSNWHRREYESRDRHGYVDIGRNRDSLIEYGWPPDLKFMFNTDEYSGTPVAEDFSHRPGPFWRLFNWRDTSRSETGEITGSYIASDGGLRGSFVQPLPDSTSIQWRPYGPIRWMRNRLYGSWMDNMSYGIPYYYHSSSWRRRILDGLQSAKIEYMFDQSRWGRGDSIDLHWPQWIGDYEKARELAEIDEIIPHQTAFYVMEYVGLIDPDSSNMEAYLRDSNYSNFYNPDWTLRRAWPDMDSDDFRFRFGTRVSVEFIDLPSTEPYSNFDFPDDLEIGIRIPMSGSWSKIADYIWHIQFSPEDFENAIDRYAETSGPRAVLRALGLPESFPDDFEVEFTAVEDLNWYARREIFAGADFGDDVPVHNPANFTSDEAEVLPKPMLLATDRYSGLSYFSNDSDSGFRGDYLNFTALAWSSAAPDAWGDKFGSANSAGVNLALSRAETFNTASFDLWTQKWKAQMIPIGQAVESINQWDIDSGLFAQLQADLQAANNINYDSLDNALSHIKKLAENPDALQSTLRH